MRRIARRWNTEAERGATAVIVAVFTSFVVIGMLALTVDVGGIMFERRQLQNGADAASLSLAQLCARKEASCSDAGAVDAIKQIASKNALDNKTSIASVCAKNIPAITTSCAAGDASVLTKCNPLPVGMSASSKYVEVVTQTLTATGGGKVLTPFAQALTGSSGSTVAACARAGLLPLGSTGATMPIVTGYCDWANATNGGTNFAPSPPTSIAPGKIWAIRAHDNTSHSSGTPVDPAKCDSSKNGQYFPGGFAWTQTCYQLGFPSPVCDGIDHADTCTTVFDATGSIVPGNSGAPPPSGCKQEMLSSFVGKTVLIPIFSSVDTVSGNYIVTGLAAFYLAGFQEIPTAKPNKTYDPYHVNPCSSSSLLCSDKDSAVFGWFTAPLVPVSSAPPGGTSYGPIQISPAG